VLSSKHLLRPLHAGESGGQHQDVPARDQGGGGLRPQQGAQARDLLRRRVRFKRTLLLLGCLPTPFINEPEGNEQLASAPGACFSPPPSARPCNNCSAGSRPAPRPSPGPSATRSRTPRPSRRG